MKLNNRDLYECAREIKQICKNKNQIITIPIVYKDNKVCICNIEKLNEFKKCGYCVIDYYTYFPTKKDLFLCEIVEEICNKIY